MEGPRGRGIFFLLPSITWNRQAFLRELGVVFPVGAVGIFFGLFNPTFPWNTWRFLLSWHSNKTQSLCPCSLEGNIGRAVLSFHSGCDMKALYDLDWIITCTLNTLQTGQIFPLTGALRAMGTTVILGSRASWWGQSWCPYPQGFLFSPSWLSGSLLPFIHVLYAPSSRVTTGFKGELIWNRLY